MKQFILGIFATVCLSSAIKTDTMTVKPALPSKVAVKYCSSTSETVDMVKNYTKLGYITKSVAGTSQYGYAWIVVMEKYE